MGKNTQSEKTGSRSGGSGRGAGSGVKILREFSSGGIVFKGGKWLIRATTPNEYYPKSYWMLPKGWLDDLGPGIPGPIASGEVKATEDILQETAIREVKEEAGIEAKIIKKIGTEKYFYDNPQRGKVLKFVTFYLMEWVRDLPEGFDGETSEIKWLPYEEARKMLSFGGEKQMLKAANGVLNETR